MPVVIQMPKLGHAMTEGTVLLWHKRAGDAVAQGELVLTVETDKAEVEVEAPASGVLARLSAAQGEVVQVGGELAVIAVNGESIPAATAPTPAAPSPTVAAPRATAATAPARGTRVIASPRAKRIAAEAGVDLGRISGSGPDGMITEDDVRRAAAAPQASAALMPARREKLTRIQAVGAKNLTQSWQQVPHFVQMVRVDMSRPLEKRRAMNAGGAKTTITDFILAAVVQALRENPRVNGSYRDGEMLIYDRINLGIAVDTPNGLVVPVIRDAQALDLGAISTRAAELAAKARDKKLLPQDLEECTFTVSNLGAYGIENGTPVIFAPQAALMFVGAIRDEVIAINGKPEVRPAMQIAIAYDHRGIDGASAARFTTRVKQLLEDGAQAAGGQEAAKPAPFRKHDVTLSARGDDLKVEVNYGPLRWSLDGDDVTGPDPVSGFLAALGGCLLMSLRVAARGRKASLGRASAHVQANEKGHVKEIQVELEVESPLDDEQLHHLVEVAERGCHIRALIKPEIGFQLTVRRHGAA
ncbi:MAG TPA: 2-oxo acid dehydrogenase subunit E2 [Candidatus Binataceae bacterium]|nr:2-oxo acid dehydrogenase subunit E2 [Candidatus Binataceae bacterium]